MQFSKIGTSKRASLSLEKGIKANTLSKNAHFSQKKQLEIIQ
jgi:hypothetical protein